MCVPKKILGLAVLSSGAILAAAGTPAWAQMCELNELQKLMASDAATGDHFSYSVSVDGDWLMVGANWDDAACLGNPDCLNSGSAYMFRRDDNGTPTDPSDDSWIQEAKLMASDPGSGDQLGFSVSISGDRLVAGA